MPRINADFGRFLRRELMTVGDSPDPGEVTSELGVSLTLDVGAFLARAQSRREQLVFQTVNPLPIGTTVTTIAGAFPVWQPNGSLPNDFLLEGVSLFFTPTGTVDGCDLSFLQSSSVQEFQFDSTGGVVGPPGFSDVMLSANMPISANGNGLLAITPRVQFPVFIPKGALIQLTVHATVATTTAIQGSLWGWLRTQDGVHFPRFL